MAHSRDLLDYQNWVKEQGGKHVGSQITEHGRVRVSAEYVPLEDLRDYWRPERVLPFLNPTDGGSPTFHLPVRELIESYLRIFSILIYMSTPTESYINYLGHFTRRSRNDVHLPFQREEDLDEVFSEPAHKGGVRERFYKHQFRFTPVQFATGNRTKLHHAELADDAVLPIAWKQDLCQNSDTAMPVAKLQQFTLQPSSGLRTPTNTLVAKIFPKDELEYTFRGELDAYNALNLADGDTQHASGYFLAYYGSFVQHGIGVILLEYADRGSLLDFFKQGNLPYERDEMFDLWTSLVNLFRGLAEVHNLDKRKTRCLRGVHQDLKPSNIFVFSDGEPSEYKFRFKIGDFGMSSFILYEKEKDRRRSMPDNKSTKVYGAPELMTWDPRLSHHEGGVEPSVDMWSVGCTLFEVVVWSICGERGLKEFLSDRQRETSTLAPACHGSFHNGKERLQAVSNMSNKLLYRLRAYDTLTEPLCDWLCTSLMVDNERDRLSASQASYHLEQVINKAKAERHAAFSNAPFPSRHQLIDLPNSSHDPGLASRPLRPSSGVSPSPASRDSMQLVSANRRTDRVEHPHGGFHNEPRMPLEAGDGPEGDENYGSGIARPSIGTRGPGARSLSSATDARRRRTDAHGRKDFPSTFSNTLTEEPEETNTTVGPHVIEPKPTLPLAPALAPALTQYQTLPPGLKRESLPPHHKGAVNGVSVRDLIQWRRNKKVWGPQELPDGLRHIPGQLNGRDQVFLVDNSLRMLPYWQNVKETVEALVSVVKGVDRDGVELRYTSKPTSSHHGKSASELLKDFASNKPRDGTTYVMESALSTLIDDLVPVQPESSKRRMSHSISRLMAKPKTGISIYILTTGVWTEQRQSNSTNLNLCGVDGSINTLVQRLRGGGRARSYVTLQFIRFGHDPAGKRVLRYLDNDLEDAKSWDIVDRRYWERSAEAIFLGPLAEHEYPSDDSDDDA